MSRNVPAPALVDGLFQLSFRLYNTLARIAAEHDLSMVQVRLLGILRDREPAMFELSRYLGLEKSSLSGLVDRAEKRGLLKRLASPSDRRAAHIQVTAQGRRLSRLVEEAANAEVAKLFAGVSRSDRARLASIVNQVVTVAGGEVSE